VQLGLVEQKPLSAVLRAELLARPAALPQLHQPYLLGLQEVDPLQLQILGPKELELFQYFFNRMAGVRRDSADRVVAHALS
jgi:hypothetical protein